MEMHEIVKTLVCVSILYGLVSGCLSSRPTSTYDNVSTIASISWPILAGSTGFCSLVVPDVDICFGRKWERQDAHTNPTVAPFSRGSFQVSVWLLLLAIVGICSCRCRHLVFSYGPDLALECLLAAARGRRPLWCFIDSVVWVSASFATLLSPEISRSCISSVIHFRITTHLPAALCNVKLRYSAMTI
jgi:hypothetical protein